VSAFRMRVQDSEVLLVLMHVIPESGERHLLVTLVGFHPGIRDRNAVRREPPGDRLPCPFPVSSCPDQADGDGSLEFGRAESRYVLANRLGPGSARVYMVKSGGQEVAFSSLLPSPRYGVPWCQVSHVLVMVPSALEVVRQADREDLLPSRSPVTAARGIAERAFPDPERPAAAGPALPYAHAAPGPATGRSLGPPAAPHGFFSQTDGYTSQVTSSTFTCPIFAWFH
jgi:hypothetical protein